MDLSNKTKSEERGEVKVFEGLDTLTVETELAGKWVWNPRQAQSEEPVVAEESTGEAGSTSEQGQDSLAANADSTAKKNNKLQFRFSTLVGYADGYTGSPSGKVKSEFPDPWKDDSKWANDWLSLTNYYVSALAIIDINHLSIGLGGGFTWSSVGFEDEDNDKKYEGKVLRSELLPLVTVEAGYVSSFDFLFLHNFGYAAGGRFNYVVDGKWPTMRFGAYAELGYLGGEIGYVHAGDLTDSFYWGFYLRLPSKTLWNSIFK